MAHPADRRAPASTGILEVTERDEPRVVEAYALLQEVLGPGSVEDIDSFWGTVSPATDDEVVPRLVCAIYRRRIQGVVLGAYLVNLNMGIVLYSGVRQAFQGNGAYSMLRSRLISLLNREASRNHDGGSGYKREQVVMEYLISELEGGSPLFQRYTGRWGAFVAPIEYEQPAAQGLTARKLKLVLQPMARQAPPSGDEIVTIVREIYERVYRIPKPWENANFRSVVESRVDISDQGKERLPLAQPR